jgi:hypothetical protein
VGTFAQLAVRGLRRMTFGRARALAPPSQSFEASVRVAPSAMLPCKNVKDPPLCQGPTQLTGSLKTRSHHQSDEESQTDDDAITSCRCVPPTDKLCFSFALVLRIYLFPYDV